MKNLSACAWCKRVNFRGRAIPGSGWFYRFFKSHGICQSCSFKEKVNEAYRKVWQLWNEDIKRKIEMEKKNFV